MNPELKDVLRPLLKRAWDAGVAHAELRLRTHTFSAGGANLAPVVFLATSRLTADPARFQFRHDHDADDGTVRELPAERFDPMKCPPLVAWHDPADGRDYVVDGHHRFAWAERDGVTRLPVRFVQARSAEEAKAVGEGLNLAAQVFAEDAQGHDHAKDGKFAPKGGGGSGTKSGGVTGRPKSKKARNEIGKSLQDEWMKARNALAVKHGTREINDLLTPEQKEAEGQLVGILRVLASGNEWNGPFDLGPVSDDRYAGYHRGALALIAKLRGEPSADQTSKDAFGAAKSELAKATDPIAKDFLESALHNATEGDEKDLAQQLASVWMHAHDLGHGEAQAAVERVMGAAGAEISGPKKGESVTHSGKLYYAPPGMFPGDAAVVVRQPVVHEDGSVLVKGQVGPAPKTFAAPGQPPRPGLVWKEETHRWVNPHTGEDHPHEPPEPVATPQQQPGQPTAPTDSSRDSEREHAASSTGDTVAAELAAESPEVHADPTLREKITQAARKAALAVYWKLPPPWSPAIQTIGGILGDVFDVPTDLGKLGYNPNMSSGTANPRVHDPVSAAINNAIGTGISGHLVASLASKVIVKALFALKGMIKGKPAEMAAESASGVDHVAAAAWLADLFDAAHVSVGLPLVDREAVATAVETLAGKSAGSE